MDASFCVEALQEALANYGALQIINTDQGSQFTGFEWITLCARGWEAVSFWHE